MKSIEFLMTLFLAITFFSCSDDGSNSDGLGAPVDVYIAGSVYNGENMVATLWKNGQSSSLTDGNSTAYGNAVAVSGNDVYVVGSERNAEDKFVAKLWKNGVATNLSNQWDMGDAYALCITIADNGDVYVGGYHYTNKAFAKYWKNGEQQIVLSDGVNDAFIKDIKVSGNDVYAVGSEQSVGARFWKNGVLVALTNEPHSSADDIFLVGQDVYIAGYEYVQGVFVATYWKNGVPIVLSDGTIDEYATNIAVQGNDVYVLGRQYDPDTQKHALKYWKNGEPVFLSQNVDYSLSTGIVVRGSDVHIAGYQRNTSGDRIAKYWINGVKTDLSAAASEANGMVVVPR